MKFLRGVLIAVLLTAALAVLHIPVGAGTAEAATFDILDVAFTIADVSAPPTFTVNLPYINGGLRSTTLVAVNKTSEPHALPDFFGKGVGPVPVVEAHSVARFAAWGGPGGVHTVKAEEGLELYVEIRTGAGLSSGIRQRISDLGAPRGSGTIYDVISDQVDPEWRAFLFVYSEEGSGVKVSEHLPHGGAASNTYWLNAGETAVVEVHGDQVTVENNIQVGPPYESPLHFFVIMSHQPAGEEFIAK